MKKEIIIPFLLFLLMLIAFNQTYYYFDNQAIKSPPEYDENKVTEGFGLNIYTNTTPASFLNITQHLQKNESMEGRVQITNAIHQKNDYLIMVLVDYKSVNFSINGMKNKTHIVTQGPMISQIYTFEIENLTAGFHDVIILTFLNPYEHSLNKEYRRATDFALMGAIRMNVLVENNLKPAADFKHVEILCNTSYPLEGILVNKEACSPNMWTSENVTQGEKLDYSINIGNNKKTEQRTFAIIQFLDYEQIPLNHNETELVYLGQLNNSEKGSIPASLIVPKEKGVHELIVVWISDPYENVEMSPGVRNTDLEGRAEPSIRIGLNVE
jgi:hypothetical protein